MSPEEDRHDTSPMWFEDIGLEWTTQWGMFQGDQVATGTERAGCTVWRLFLETPYWFPGPAVVWETALQPSGCVFLDVLTVPLL